MRRTTIALDERVWERIREKARAERRDFQDCANELLRLALGEAQCAPAPVAPLPVFDLGPSRVDLTDRDALEELMGES